MINVIAKQEGRPAPIYLMMIFRVTAPLFAM